VKRILLLTIVILLAAGATTVQAADDLAPQAIRAGKIVTVSGDVINNGVILIQGDKIKAVGADVDVPPGAEVFDMADKTVTPGLIDAHCYLGLSPDYRTEIDETVEPVTAAMQIADAFDATDEALNEAVRSGVTTAMIAPGSRNPIAGQTAVIKLAGQGNDAWLVKRTAGLKFSFANDALTRDRKPTSRPGLVTLIQENLDRAKTFTPETFDPTAKVLHRVTQKELPVFACARTTDEIATAMDVIDKYELNAVLLGGWEADELANLLVERDIPVICQPLLLSSRDKDLKRPARMIEAGGKIAFASWAPVTRSGDIRTSAALAVRYGLDRQEALKAVTFYPAQMLGLTQRLGSIEPGKDADLVVFKGDPLELTSPVEMVIVEGNVVYRREPK